MQNLLFARFALGGALTATLCASILALSPDERPRSESRLLVLNKSEATMSILDPASGETTDVWPTGSGPHEIAVSPDGKTAVASNYGEATPGHTLTVFDLTGQDAPRTIELGTDLRPHGIVFEGAERVLVTSEESHALLRVDLGNEEVLARMPTGQELSHMVVALPDGSRAFVANIGSGSCTAIDLASGEILAQIETGAGSEGIAVTPDGRQVWVTNRAANTVSVIDAASLEVLITLESSAFPIRVKITPDGKSALVSNAQSGSVSVFDVPTHTLRTTVSMEITAAETEGRLFGDRFGQSPVPIGILIRPDGKRAYIANTNADLVTVLDLESWKVVGRLETGKQPDGLGWAQGAS